LDIKDKKLCAVIGDIVPQNNDLNIKTIWICDNEREHPDLVCDYRVIPELSNKYDLVISSVLDKFKIDESTLLIKEWYRIVKSGGTLQVKVTNAAKAALEILRADANENYETGIHDLLYESGKQVSFTRNGLRRTINDAGFDCDITEKDDNIIAEIKKTEKSEIFNITKTFEKFIRADADTLEKKVDHAIALGAMQKRYELMEMAKAIEAKKPKTIVEIGTANGETFSLFCQICPKDAILISIDLPGSDFSRGYPENDILKLKSFARGDQQIHCISENSHLDETKNKLLKIIKEIDVLFIDGDHSYESVKRDFELYSPLMSKGGLIFFHDILFHPFNHGCEVNIFWRQLKEKHEVTEFIDKDDINWGGIGMFQAG
jgi:predicted O-methyltransferase YrrM